VNTTNEYRENGGYLAASQSRREGRATDVRGVRPGHSIGVDRSEGRRGRGRRGV